MVVHSAKRVLDASPEALSRKVLLGMGLPEAKAILGEDAVYRECAVGEYMAERDRWLDVCVEFSDGIEPESPATAFIDLSGHPDPADVALRLVRELERRLGWSCLAGLAPAKWVARIAARPVEGAIAPVRDPRGFLALLPTAMLAPAPPEHRQRLEFLGYRRIGEVARAPLRVLIEQFGKDGVLIREAAQGRASDRVRPSYPPDSEAERIAFEGGLESQEEIKGALRELAERMSDRLSGRDLEGSTVMLFVEGADDEVLTERKKLSKPVQSAACLRVAFETLFARMSVEQAVTAVRAVMPGLRRAMCRQRCFEPTSVPRERKLAAESALLRVRAAFGDEMVQRASEVEVPRRVKLLRVWQHATGWS